MLNKGTHGKYWEVQPPQDDVCFFVSLWELVPERAVLYFEGVYDERFVQYLKQHEDPSKEQIPGGTIWPKPDVHHVQLANLNKHDFVDAVRNLAVPTVSMHFLVYDGGATLVEFHDAFSDNPLWLAASFAENDVKRFCDKNNVTYKLVQEC